MIEKVAPASESFTPTATPTAPGSGFRLGGDPLIDTSARVPLAPPADTTRSRLTLPAVLRIGDVLSMGAGLAVAASVAAPGTGFHVAALALLVLVLLPRHHWRFTLSALDDLPLLAGAVATATLATIAWLAITDSSFHTAERAVRALVAGVSLLAVMSAGRAITFATARALRRRRVGIVRAVIVGVGSIGCQLGDVLATTPRRGVDLVGYVDDVPARLDGRRMLGTLESLPNVLRDHQIDVVIVAFGAGGCHALVDPIRAIGPTPVDIYIIPRLYELHSRISTDIVAGIPLIRLRRLAFRSPSWPMKRAIDLLAATTGLLLTAPAMAMIAIAVRWETGPGVIYRQRRVGMGGQEFTLYKFRSLKPVGVEDVTTWSIDNDPRLGPVGRFIRASSLDELPQLVNILRGEMSLVGPRPERPHFVDQFSKSVPGYRYRHRMPVGLTGFAAVNGLRGDTKITERAHFDNLYAESWSIWLDTKIIIRTVSQVVRGRRPFT